MVLKEDGALNAIKLLFLNKRAEEHSVRGQLATLEQSATYTMAVNPNIASSLPVFQQLATEIATRKKLQQLVSSFETLF